MATNLNNSRSFSLEIDGEVFNAKITRMFLSVKSLKNKVNIKISALEASKIETIAKCTKEGPVWRFRVAKGYYRHSLIEYIKENYLKNKLPPKKECGKQKYKDKASAISGKIYLMNNVAEEYSSRHPYYCHQCNAWHLGRSKMGFIRSQKICDRVYGK